MIKARKAEIAYMYSPRGHGLVCYFQDMSIANLERWNLRTREASNASEHVLRVRLSWDPFSVIVACRLPRQLSAAQVHGLSSHNAGQIRVSTVLAPPPSLMRPAKSLHIDTYPGIASPDSAKTSEKSRRLSRLRILFGGLGRSMLISAM